MPSVHQQVKAALRAHVFGMDVIFPPPPSSAAAIVTALRILEGLSSTHALTHHCPLLSVLIKVGHLLAEGVRLLVCIWGIWGR